ncbi:hypothetical protein V0M98_38355 (plasmid) [Pseudomonas silesiensis]|uniref:hypothetical protein n=1 Tax=Pseudomonas silesiensis TaxID=1853130 RepID=UPI0030D0C56B
MKDPAAKFLEHALSTGPVTLQLRASKGLTQLDGASGMSYFMAYVDSPNRNRSATPEFFPCMIELAEHDIRFLTSNVKTGAQLTATGRMVHGNTSAFMVEKLELALAPKAPAADKTSRKPENDTDAYTP